MVTICNTVLFYSVARTISRDAKHVLNVPRLEPKAKKVAKVATKSALILQIPFSFEAWTC